MSSALVVEPWATDLVRDFEQEISIREKWWSIDDRFHKVDAGRRIVECDRAGQAELLVAFLLRLNEIDERDVGWRRPDFFFQAVVHVLHRKLPFSEQRLASLIAVCGTNLVYISSHSILAGVLRQADFIVDEVARNGPLAAALALVSQEAASAGFRLPTRIRASLARLLERLTGDETQAVGLPASPWRDKVLADLDTIAGEQKRAARVALKHATGAVNKSKADQAFLSEARRLLEKHPELAPRIMGWIESHAPQAGHPDLNDDVIRGLIWMLGQTKDADIASRLGQYCELCFKKVPKIGAHSVKLGHGAIQALGMLAGAEAVAELTRLKSRVRYPRVIGRIDATLSELAARLGISEVELEEIGLPSFGLSWEGERRLPAGDGFAIIRLAGTRDARLTWLTPDGKEVASVPKALKRTAPEVVAAARRLKKEVAGALAGQSARLERLYLSTRRIPLQVWRERYLEHPLVAELTRRLIWRFAACGTHVAGIARNDMIEDVNGRPIEVSSDVAVELWHPLHATADHVLDWRKRLGALGIIQPFKQAHRELYIVTDAERQTEIYSNRFAAHILRQHQFKALCDQRGWRYQIIGPWNSANTPTRVLPDRRLAVEFWVNPIDDAATTALSGYELIATDQVRLVAADGEPVRIADAPPLVFSELMRDVDLFVGIASVGNDPNWVDGGPQGRFQAYWADYAFGALSETARTRARALELLLPQLAIADQCALEDRFLAVRGKLRTYRIHLGSANIQMDPNNQYLCIVPGRGLSDRSNQTKPERTVLPFEGDHVLSIILSKAFLLAEDDRIKDPTILRQIKPTDLPSGGPTL
jgi:hypothetical protein